MTHTFTPKEISQIAQLTRLWADGDSVIDARRFSRRVRQWAEVMGLVRRGDDGRLHTGDPFFDMLNSLPAEVMHEILKPAIDAHSGFSINRAEEWRGLNIYPAGSRFDTFASQSTRENVLLKLDMAGLIRFFASGNVWRIYATR